MKDLAYIALDPTVTSDNVDSASWDLGWLFTGTVEKGVAVLSEEEQRKQNETRQPTLIYDDELGTTFSLGQQTLTMQPRVTSVDKEDHYQLDDTETYVVMVHDDQFGFRYLVIVGPHDQKLEAQIAETLKVVDRDEAERRFYTAPTDSEKITALYLLAIVSKNTQEVPELLKQALESSHDVIREAADVGLRFIASTDAAEIRTSTHEQSRD